MATNTTTGATTNASAIDEFLAPGKRVIVWLWPEVWMAAERDRKAVGTIVATDAAGVLLDGQRHAHESPEPSFLPWSSVAAIDVAGAEYFTNE